MDDLGIVTRQLGRELTCNMAPVSRCTAGFPVVVRNEPVTRDGVPFPTLYWLTCPSLCTDISRLEASGAVVDFERLLQSPETRTALLASDLAYRRERVEDGGAAGTALLEVGIAGNRDPLHIKCLHAHAADFLAAGLNPIGEKVLERAPMPIDCRICAVR